MVTVIRESEAESAPKEAFVANHMIYDEITYYLMTLSEKGIV